MTQKETFLAVLYDDPDKWHYSYAFVNRNTKYGWLGTDILRVARQLREDNLIEQRPQGKYVQYKAKIDAPIDIWRVEGRIIRVKV